MIRLNAWTIIHDVVRFESVCRARIAQYPESGIIHDQNLHLLQTYLDKKKEIKAATAQCSIYDNVKNESKVQD
jgi:hypothetical protein